MIAVVRVVRQRDGHRSVAGGGNLQLFYRPVYTDPEFTFRISQRAPVGRGDMWAGFSADADILQGGMCKGIHHDAPDQYGLCDTDFTQEKGYQ